MRAERSLETFFRHIRNTLDTMDAPGLVLMIWKAGRMVWAVILTTIFSNAFHRADGFVKQNFLVRGGWGVNFFLERGLPFISERTIVKIKQGKEEDKTKKSAT